MILLFGSFVRNLFAPMINALIIRYSAADIELNLGKVPFDFFRLSFSMAPMKRAESLRDDKFEKEKYNKLECKIHFFFLTVAVIYF